MRYLIPFFLALAACGAPPDFTGPIDEGVYTNAYPVEEERYWRLVEDATASWQAVLGDDCDFLGSPGDLDVEFVADDDPILSWRGYSVVGRYRANIGTLPETVVSGKQYGIWLAYRDLMEHTALTHEVSHHVLYRCGYGADRDHSLMADFGDVFPELRAVTQVIESDAALTSTRSAPRCAVEVE